MTGARAKRSLLIFLSSRASRHRLIIASILVLLVFIRDLNATLLPMARSPENSDAPDSLPFVQLFTDGACRGNPGPGGWAYILRHPASGQEKEVAGGVPDTTNNQMELQALIEGLKALRKRSSVEVITDSTYVAKGCHEWMPGWKRNGWRRREGKSWKPVKNVEQWQLLDELLAKHQVTFTVVKGHAGHAENERCDVLAVEAAAAIG